MTRGDPPAVQRLTTLLRAPLPWPPPAAPQSGGGAPEVSIEVHPESFPSRDEPLPPPDAAGSGEAGLSGRVRAVVRRWAPESWRGARLDPGRPGATALALVTLTAAVVAAVGVWSQRPRVEPVDALPTLSVSTAAPVEASTTTSGEPPEPLVVSVVGRVARPGLVRVAEGSRVADVLDAAGGPLPETDLTGINLARRVTDGEQVAVGVPGPPDQSPPAGAHLPVAPEPAGPVDLNTATAAQLDQLPGVGPVMAQRIVEWRTRNGRFVRVEQLREIEGIGERRFAQLRELVRV